MGRKKTIKTIDELLENSKTDQQPQEENLVKKTCRELGITQKELAERLGVTQRTITNWINGTIEIPVMAINLIEMFHLERNYIQLQTTLSIFMEKQIQPR